MNFHMYHFRSHKIVIMPQSRKRKVHHAHHVDFIPHEKKRKSVMPFTVILCTLFAIGIAWMADTESSWIVLLASAAGGLIIGYYAGRRIDAALKQMD